MKKLHSFCLVILILIGLSGTNPAFSQEAENLNVFDRWIEWSDGKNMLVHQLNNEAFAYLDKRDEEVARLKTKDDWVNRQQKVKEILWNTVGPFPEKTPLNARVTGVVKKDGFRIEKIVYESMPNLYVTACLFIPDIKARTKVPAIIQVSGHGFPAFRSAGTQKQLYNLVKRGFVVLAIDPLGQGERLQYWDDTKKTSMMGTSPTSEHSYFGNQMFVAGISPIRYFIWDGIRGVDYLLTRKEVDPERIGIFGCSGGGTQTTFIAAFDERIKAAVPGCYITGFRRLLESIGPQDAEQNLYKGVMNGITHADLLEVRAPKPLLISSTTRDFFSIQGAIETFDEVKQVYKVFGAEDQAAQVFDDAGHGFNKNITAIYAFFQKVFNTPGITEELDFKGFDPADLQVTTTGQLATSLGGDLAFNISERESQKMIQKLAASRNNRDEHLKNVLVNAGKISGYTAPSEKGKPVFRGRYQRNGYAVEMYALTGEGKTVVPLLLFVPSTGSNFPVVVYLNPAGKAADAAPGGRIEQLVKKGYLVAAPDVLGTGETAGRGDAEAVLLGRSVAGMQAGDVTRVINFLRSRIDVNMGKISGMAFDEMGPVLLHAAALNKAIGSVALSGSLISYRSVVVNKFYNTGFASNAVAGALTAYDLPDLIASLAPRKIALVDSKDQMKQTAGEGLIKEELAFPGNVYSARNAAGNLRIIPATNDMASVAGWCLE